LEVNNEFFISIKIFYIKKYYKINIRKIHWYIGLLRYLYLGN